MTRIGVYTMGNDPYADWVLAFLESFRAYNPSTELIFIPFDDRIDRIASLASKYNFTLFDDSSLLRRLDNVGAALSPDAYWAGRCFRKFAAFAGPFDHFLYLDADIVVLSALEEWIRRIAASGADFTFFDTSSEWVYSDPDFKAYMEHEFNARCFAAGAFAARKGLINIDEVEALVPQNSRLKPMMYTGLPDQSYMNYIVDTKRSKVAASLDVIPELYHSNWAPNLKGVESSQLRGLGSVPITQAGKIVPFLHWAGFKCRPSIPNLRVFQHFRLLAEPSRLKRLTWRCQFALRALESARK